MAKLSRACLGAMLLACVALPVLSAEQQHASGAAANATTNSATTDAKQQRIEQLGDALRRIQDGAAKQPAHSADVKPTVKPASAAITVAATEKPVSNPNQLVSVKVSKELESHPAFQQLMKDLPHALMNNGTTEKADGELLLKKADVAKLSKDVDAQRAGANNKRLDELASSLRAVQAAKFDLPDTQGHVDAAPTDEIQPAAPGTQVPTPAQIDAQQLGGSAPAPSPAQNPGLDTKAVVPATPAPVVYGASPPSNPSPPPATPPAPAPAVPAANAPTAPVVPAANAPATPAPGTAAPLPPATQPAAPAGDSNSPVPPGKRDDMAEPAPNESNAQISAKIRELAGKGKQAITESGVSSANGKGKVSVEAPDAKPFQGDPLEQRVNLDFREMELTNVVALLASKAGINVIAGTDLTGTVTANLKNVPLRQAMETALRMNGLGMVIEEGIYRIVPYEQAIATKRVNQMLNLQNAKAEEVRKVLEDIIKGSPDEKHVNLSANQGTNILVISGPEARVPELVAMANKLDVAKPVLPTITEAIKLNYAEPKDVLPTVTAMVSKDIGKVAIDDRSRHLIITDIPIVVENIREMLKTLDMAVKTVSIETMIVDVTLTDDAETGVDWVTNLLRSQSLREQAKGADGRFVSDVQKLSYATSIPGGATAGALTFGLLSGNINLTGMIKAELQNVNGKLMSSPTVLTVENKPATITIAEEIPYIELIQTAAGGQQNKTSFKDVGTLMEVTPRVTHDNFIISQLKVKESNTTGTFNNVPIENKRELSTSLRTADGQTVFMGGLRKNSDDLTVRKVPVLGDIPVVNFLFRNNKKDDRKNEMVVFLTCRVVKDGDELTPHQQDKLGEASDPKLEVNGGNELLEYTIHPGELRDPVWKYRRTDR